MPTTKAIIVSNHKTISVEDVKVPQLRDEWVIVQVKAVALNPADFKKIDWGDADAGSRLGYDYAGIVSEVGSKVSKFQKGDRIAGFVHGGDATNHDNGAFGEFIIAKACIQIKIPNHLDFIEASTLGAGMITCGLGLYKHLQLPLPPAKVQLPTSILIHGGSTATATIGIQLAKASGLYVIATASPYNFDNVKALGADAVFDYHSPECGEQIRALTENKLKLALDCAGEGEVICGKALSSVEPSLFCTIFYPINGQLLKDTNPLAQGPLLTAAYNSFGESWKLGGNPMAANIEEMEFSARFVDIVYKLLEQGRLRPIKPTVNKFGAGLQGVIKGVDELRQGKVRGTKLVYTI
ncbi:unnamed protein product [Clonostachys chloroleuca]|uniref:Enoyl reductase (ER) domain-containing protein n=1 Tax=Clonostachys chloroleuca TaxID=1926264 RepID=A0AA35M1S0_9HYPO|nr:unnamed protein product [Clonostachys chloroleuca]